MNQERKREKKYFTTAKSEVKNISLNVTKLIYEAVGDSNISILLNLTIKSLK